MVRSRAGRLANDGMVGRGRVSDYIDTRDECPNGHGEMAFIDRMRESVVRCATCGHEENR